MSKKSCMIKAKERFRKRKVKTVRVSFVCMRAGELRKGKTIKEMSQKEAFEIAHEEYEQFKKKLK